MGWGVEAILKLRPAASPSQFLPNRQYSEFRIPEGSSRATQREQGAQICLDVKQLPAIIALPTCFVRLSSSEATKGVDEQPVTPVMWE